MADFTQEQLEEMVVGKSPNPNAIFFEHAALNVPRSKEAGRRMYDKKVFIKLSHPGVTDSVSYEAKQEDIRKYPEEYQYFLRNKQGERKPGVEIIPNLDIAHLQELRDYGILTIPQLAELENVPPHLDYAHRAAKIFNAALQEANHGNEERSIEEDSGEEGRSEETQTLSQADRQQHDPEVGRREVPASDRREEVGRIAGRHGQDRPAQRGNGVDYSEANFVVR